MQFEKFLRIPFLQESSSGCFWRTFNSCFQRSTEQKPARLSTINTRFSSEKKVFSAAKIQKQLPCSVKEGLQGLAQVFSCEHWKMFKSTYFEKHREQLLLKISTSVTNLPKEGNSWFFFFILLNLFSILNFGMTEWFSHVTCSAKVFLLLFFFSQTYFYHKKLFYNTHQVHLLEKWDPEP